MKMLTLRKQRGFSLFDTMLAITVIAIVFIGIGALFLHAKSNSDVQNTITAIDSVTSASTQFLTEDYSATLTQEDLINSGLLPSNLVSGDSIYGPLGGISVSVADKETQHQKFTITAGVFTTDQARSLCQQLVGTYYLTDSTKNTYDTPSDCTSGTFTEGDIFTLGYPKAAF